MVKTLGPFPGRSDVYVYVYVYMCICVYVYVCVYMYDYVYTLVQKSVAIDSGVADLDLWTSLLGLN